VLEGLAEALELEKDLLCKEAGIIEIVDSGKWEAGNTRDEVVHYDAGTRC